MGAQDVTRHEALVKLLIEKRVRIDAQAYKASPALHQAAQNGHEAVVRLLIVHHACHNV